MFEAFSNIGLRKKVLAIPPDFTRFHSFAGQLTQEEIESVNFQYADLNAMQKKYNPEKLKDGFNVMPDGEEIFYISNPALGLWAFKDRFK